MTALFGTPLCQLSFPELHDRCMSWYRRDVLANAANPLHGRKETAAIQLHGIIRTIRSWQEIPGHGDLEAHKLLRDFEAMPFARIPEDEWIRQLLELSNQLKRKAAQNGE